MNFVVVVGEFVLVDVSFVLGIFIFFCCFSLKENIVLHRTYGFKYEIACKLLLSSSSVQLQQLVANQKYSSLLVPGGCISL